MTVATVLAETNGFILFKNASQLVSYCGYDVVENQSGKYKGKTRISKKGNRHIRRILHMPAFNDVIRYEVSPFVQLFNRTIAKHHQKMKSYVAVQKKILVIIYSLWKADQSFDENYFQKYITGDEELVHPLGSASQKLSNLHQKNSPELNQGYTRYATVEESPFASSRLVQK